MADQGQLRILAEAILSDHLVGSSPTLSLEQFKHLYRHLEKIARERGTYIGEPEILLLTGEALIRFPVAPNYVVYVAAKRRSLTPKDFEIVLEAKPEGNIRPITTFAFIWTELRRNGIVLLLIGVTLSLLLRFDDDLSITTTINQMLVEANALFISIFVLFTVSQNRDHLVVRELSRRGLIHQLMQNDKYIALLSVSSLLMAFVSTTAVSIGRSASPFVTIPLVNITLNLHFWSRAVTAISLVLLVDCFLSIINYYVRVMTKTIETKMINEWIAGQETSESQKKNPSKGNDISEQGASDAGEQKATRNFQ
jgi:hypothetical protein